MVQNISIPVQFCLPLLAGWVPPFLCHALNPLFSFEEVFGVNRWVLRTEPGNSGRIVTALLYSITSLETMSVVLSQLSCGSVLWKGLEFYDSYIHMNR